MNLRWSCCVALAGLVVVVGAWYPSPSVRLDAAEPAGAKIVFIVGPSQHPPGTHEVAAGARLLKHCVEHAPGIGPVTTEIFYQWPQDPKALDGAATIVFTGDLFPPERMEEPDKAKAQLAELMDRGCGIVCVHYATGLRAQHVSDDGDHPLLRWLGGYFATGCEHHKSVARVCRATVVPEKVDHPVLRGWREFTFDDEPYWNNYFGQDGPAENVTPLAFAMLPPDAPKKETIVWAVERKDGGRGVGMVIPHYFQSWKLDDLRTLALNAICWTAKLEVPPDGVEATLPDLARFEPESVEPKPRKRK